MSRTPLPMSLSDSGLDATIHVRRRLPVFPLPVVLLPGTDMPLHIFEQRYRDMVRDALDHDRRFGMVFHDWDDMGPYLNEEGRVGCVAEIEQHQELPDGRSLLLVHGVERFSIEDGIESDALYFEALVSPYRDAPADADPDQVVARREASIALFQAVIASMDDAPEALPEPTSEADPSFALAQTIQVDPRWHQELLEFRSEAARLSRLDAVFRALLD